MPSQYKLGALPRDPEVPVLKLENYLTTGGLPASPNVVDRATRVSEWPMYMNGPDPQNPPASPNGLGDCEIARIGHFIQAATTYASGTTVTVPDSSILSAYESVAGYNPRTGANDNGSTTQAALDYYQKTGFEDSNGKVHKIAGFAAFGDPTDLELMHQVLNTFGSVFVDVNLPASAEEQFGQIWEYEPFSPIEGGHAINLQQVVTDQPGIYHFVTWGALQKATISWVENYTSDAWVVVTQDWIDSNGTTIEGLDLTQLLSDMVYV